MVQIVWLELLRMTKTYIWGLNKHCYTVALFIKLWISVPKSLFLFQILLVFHLVPMPMSCLEGSVSLHLAF